MSPFTDRQMDQIDAAAARRVRDDEWRACKPTKNAEVDKVRARVQAYLDTPDSYPLVVAEPLVQDQLNRAAAKAERRRFTGEPVTAFGELA